MSLEDHYKKLKFERIRRVKKWLRYVPRKATLHKYPLVGFFAKEARQCAYLWSFRSENVIPALYAGWVLSLMPVYGFQLILAFVAAIVFRGNFMILAALQMITNPLTIVPIYYVEYKVGQFLLDIFTSAETEELREIYQGLSGMSWRMLGKGLKWFVSTSIGGILFGYIAGVISVFFYKIWLKRFEAKHKKTFFHRKKS